MGGLPSTLVAFALFCTAVSGENYYGASSFYRIQGSVASGMPTTQSSTTSGGVSSRAVDGGLSGRFWDGTCTHTTGRSDENAWWNVDLGESMEVSKVVLFNRLDCCSERLIGAQVFVGDADPQSGDVTTNSTLCGEPADGVAVEQPQSVFDCSISTSGRYITVRLPEPGVPLSLCEVVVFSEPTEPETILEPHLNSDSSCPGPLAPACETYVEEGLSAEDAALKAFMEGPVDCGGLGFFCLMSQDPAGVDGGMTGTPGDQFINNRNVGFCVDRDEDRQINWNDLSRQPNNNDAHCHGSEFDTSYEGVLNDHYYRPYRGTITCCCGLQNDDEDGKWAPAKDYISRCDYRGETANDAAKNFERGCGRDMFDFIPKDAFPNEKCWTLDNFGYPPEGVYEKPKYSTPALNVASCDSTAAFTGCVLDLDSRDHGESLLLISQEKSEAPYMVDDIKGCDEVHGVEISEVGLQLVEFDNLDRALTNQVGEAVTPNVTYMGCFKDNGRRAFQTRRSGSFTMEECATAAVMAGSTVFGLQYPQGHRDNKAECHFDDKPGALGSDTYPQVADEECIGEDDWAPSAFGQTFPWNGAGWRNAVYMLVSPGSGEEQDELTTEFRKLEGLSPGETYHVQVMDLRTCALGALVELVVPAGTLGEASKVTETGTEVNGISAATSTMGRKLMGRRLM